MTDSISGGMAVDILTGRPKGVYPTEKDRLLEGQLEVDVATGFEADQKLKTRAGKLFVSLIDASLQRRIEELVNADPESMALLGLLSKLGHDIQKGEAAAKRLTRMRLGRQSRELPSIE